MTFDLQRVLESKRALRRRLAARPLGEKLRMLNALRERMLSLRGSGGGSGSTALRERSAPYRSGKA